MINFLAFIGFIVLVYEYGFYNTLIIFILLAFTILIITILFPSILNKKNEESNTYISHINLSDDIEKKSTLNEEDEKDFDEHYSVWHHTRGYYDDDEIFDYTYNDSNVDRKN